VPWEFDVQVHVHKRRVPVQFPERVLVGFDDATLKAYIHFVMLDDENIVFVRAVACDYGSRGNGYAADAYDAMFEDLAQFGWIDDFEVEGNIHRLNVASQRAFERAGGYFIEDATSDMEVWRIARPRSA
jgi:RimJ/RimL family protein N-acetyltransferase